MHALSQENRTTINEPQHQKGAPNSRAETYGRSGQVCMMQAEIATSSNERRLWLGMAEQWFKLSEMSNTAR
jgi:hypothetical protein